MKHIYDFNEGNAQMRDTLGGKGANLAEMQNLGMPVPYGFTISCQTCIEYYQNNEKLSDDLINEIKEHLQNLENKANKKLGSSKNPLLVSVRSGARVSMPGMMDTILNLGLNDEVVEGMIKLTNNERFVYDSYRRFIQMFADVVMGVDKDLFEHEIDRLKKIRNVELDTQLDSKDLQELVTIFKQIYLHETKQEFPQDPFTQLKMAIQAVFASWNNPRAIYYRKMNEISDDWGTAVNIQMMVFGNIGETSGTGVAFTRNPSTGEHHLFGEFLLNAQGEDVVAGIRTPQPIRHLKAIMPNVYNEFCQIADKLEHHYKDMQDMEFTIENGKLFMLQTRNGKRTGKAALKIACDLVDEQIIDKETALMRVDPMQLNDLLHPTFDDKALKQAEILGKGIAASPGAASGRMVFTAQEAINAAKNDEKVILVRLETSPEDIEGMHSAQGILTARGGMTSHAAVVARGMGKCCVSGCKELKINENKRQISIGDKQLNENDFISLDGSTGMIYAQDIPKQAPRLDGDFKRFMKWSDEYRRMEVLANADTIADAKQAITFGAEGIGLVRSEHMFFEQDRIKAIREMIVAKTSEQRQTALDKILPMQQSDFEGIFEVMGERAVTVRYLDPPLHEFLPKTSYDITQLAKDMNVDIESLKQIIASLHEFNPMMGHRGCRLAISYPEIAIMQTKAIMQAAINVQKTKGIKVSVKLMIPLVGTPNELAYLKNIIEDECHTLLDENDITINYQIGTMIEIPRSALVADEIAKYADFFSFGTNDLTQMTYGFSRDDASSFLNDYYDKNIYENDPFVHIDEKGVGELIKMATMKGRSVKTKLKVGVCGEHGGDAKSINFFEKIKLDYVSCSPYRIPIARLAAAQAVIRNK